MQQDVRAEEELRRRESRERRMGGKGWEGKRGLDFNLTIPLSTGGIGLSRAFAARVRTMIDRPSSLWEGDEGFFPVTLLASAYPSRRFQNTSRCLALSGLESILGESQAVTFEKS